MSMPTISSSPWKRIMMSQLTGKANCLLALSSTGIIKSVHHSQVWTSNTQAIPACTSKCSSDPIRRPSADNTAWHFSLHLCWQSETHTRDSRHLCLVCTGLRPTMAATLSAFATRQSKATTDLEAKVNHFLDYCATHPNAGVRFVASDMLLALHSNEPCACRPRLGVVCDTSVAYPSSLLRGVYWHENSKRLMILIVIVILIIIFIVLLMRSGDSIWKI